MTTTTRIGAAQTIAAALLLLIAPKNTAQVIERIDPIVVTATRTEERAFDLPLAIDSLDAAQIQQNQLQINLSESLARVPGLSVQNRWNYAQDLQISSRGFGARAAFGVRGIRLYQDGIPATMPDGQGQTGSFSLASAKRIEVLRGPFSTLYGNAAGGVISVFTEDGPDPPQAQAQIIAGSYGTWCGGRHQRLTLIGVLDSKRRRSLSLHTVRPEADLTLRFSLPSAAQRKQGSRHFRSSSASTSRFSTSKHRTNHRRQRHGRPHDLQEREQDASPRRRSRVEHQPGRWIYGVCVVHVSFGQVRRRRDHGLACAAASRRIEVARRSGGERVCGTRVVSSGVAWRLRCSRAAICRQAVRKRAQHRRGPALCGGQLAGVTIGVKF